MSLYAGSNYGVISTLNSGSGNLFASATYTFNYELVQNYTSATLLIDLSGKALTTINVLYSNDTSDTIIAKEAIPLLKEGNYTFDIKPKGKYLRVQLINNSPTITGYKLQTIYNNTSNPEENPGYVSDVQSSGNSIYVAGPVSSSADISGNYEDISEYSLITIMTNGSAASSASGTIRAIFSMDGINEDRIVSYVVQDVTANGSTSTNTSLTFNPAHTLLPISRYFKLQYVNDTVALTSLRISTIYHKNKSKPLTSRVTQGLTDQYDADTARSILVGRTLGTILPQGHYQNVGIQNQSLSCFIREPTTAFGEVLQAQLTPIIQFDFSNGDPNEIFQKPYRNSEANTSYNYNNALLTISADTSGSVIEGTSSEYTKYKAGQGIDARFTAVFDPSGSQAGCSQYTGLFTPENSLTFGYFDTSGFCIRYGRNGVQQIQRIDISGTSTTTGNITLTIGGTSVTAPTDLSGNAIQAAAAIVKAINSSTNYGLNTYGWKGSYTTADGGVTARVELIRNYTSSTQITFSITSPQLGYTFGSFSSPYRSGVSTQYQYIQQNDWNINTCKDMGSLQQNYLRNGTGFILNPLLGNVYRIVFQYLGFGAITFSIENPETGFYLPVHQIKYANTSLLPSVSSPNYRIGYGVENTTKTTRTQIQGGSISAFIQGQLVVSPLYRSYPGIISGNSLNNISKANARVLFGFRVTQSKASINSSGSNTITLNRSNLILNSISCSLNAIPSTVNTIYSANIIFQIVKNPTAFYTGNPTTTIFNPSWRLSELDSSLEVFDGTATTSTTTGIGYTGGINIFDLALVENTAITYDLKVTSINISADDIYIVSVYGNTSINGTGSPTLTYDILSAISYQINN